MDQYINAPIYTSDMCRVYVIEFILSSLKEF